MSIGTCNTIAITTVFEDLQPFNMHWLSQSLGINDRQLSNNLQLSFKCDIIGKGGIYKPKNSGC